MEVEVVNNNGKKLNVTSPTVIKVVGCGGGGGNAVDCMIDANIQNVEFIALNTDLQVLSESKADEKIQIGKKCAGGLGAGGRPEVGEEAAKEDEEVIKGLLKDADMVFVTAGMGGGTGTGSAPVVARIAREQGALTVAVVTKPFTFEGPVRMSQAEAGIKKLHEEVDSLIVIPNQHVLDETGKRISIPEAFRKVDDILRQGVQGISDIITKKGLINLDFRDVSSAMKGQGDAIFGIGIGEGENRATDAATAAIGNKLLENTNIDGAKNILINICGNDQFSLNECEEIVRIVTASADSEARVIWGQVIDNNMGETVSVTVIATGFHSNKKPDSGVAKPVVKKPIDSTNELGYGDFQDLVNPKTPVVTPVPQPESPAKIAASVATDRTFSSIPDGMSGLFDTPVYEEPVKKAPIPEPNPMTAAKTAPVDMDYLRNPSAVAMGKTVPPQMQPTRTVPPVSRPVQPVKPVSSSLQPPKDFESNPNDLSQPAIWHLDLSKLSKNIGFGKE